MKNYETMRAKRDADFVGRCRELLKTGRFSGDSDSGLIRQAIETAPRAYYVSYQHAYRMLTRFRSRGRFGIGNVNAIGLWASLLKDVEECQQLHNLSLSHALSRVLAENHPPKFYIAPSTAAKIYRYRYRQPRRPRRPFPTNCLSSGGPIPPTL